MAIHVADQIQHVLDPGRPEPQQQLVQHGQSPLVDLVEEGLLDVGTRRLGDDGGGGADDGLDDVPLAEFDERAPDVFELVHYGYEVAFLAVAAAGGFLDQFLGLDASDAIVLLLLLPVLVAPEEVVHESQQHVLRALGGAARRLPHPVPPPSLVHPRLVPLQLLHQSPLFVKHHIGEILEHIRAIQRRIVLQFGGTPQIHQRLDAAFPEEDVQIGGGGVGHASDAIDPSGSDAGISHRGEVARVLDVLEGEVAFGAEEGGGGVEFFFGGGWSGDGDLG
mmetsp:Transcript_6848/g.13110  ORF Transcript_6848/g.13110 Transcript_6848/m.13110 type:complete len:278 (+) Transcript_6848:542-1375(+)